MKLRFALIVAFNAVPLASLPAQHSNTHYVSEFHGRDVETKLANAMNACNPSSSAPCVLIIDPSLLSNPGGTVPTLCAGCSAQDYRLAVQAPQLPGVTSDGNQGVKVAGNLTASSINLVILADLQRGSDCGAKVAAADSTAPSGYVIQVGGNCGTWTTSVALSSNRAIYFAQAGTYTFSCPSQTCLTLGGQSAAFGLPIASNTAPVAIKMGNGANSPALIAMGGGSTIHDLMLDGNKANQTSALDVVLVNDANRVHLYNLTVHNARRDDLHVTNTTYPAVTKSQALALNTTVTLNARVGGVKLYRVTTAGTGAATYPSCSAVLNSTCTWGSVVFTNIGATLDNASGDGYLGPNVLLDTAGRHDFFTERNADWIVDSQVEMLSAAQDGFHCEDCATYRFANDDFGSNGRYGWYASVVNAQCSTGILTIGHMLPGGAQFGGEGSGDIYWSGSAATNPSFCSSPSALQLAGAGTITGNTFLTAGTASQNSITLVDAGANAITGNEWGGFPWGTQYQYAVASSFVTMTGSNRQGSVIKDNSFANVYSNPPYTASTPYSITPGVDVAEAYTSPGVETEWANKELNGARQFNGPATFGGAVTFTASPGGWGKSGLWAGYSGGVSYHDAVGPNGSTIGTHCMRQMTMGASSYFNSLCSDTSGNWTVHGNVSAGQGTNILYRCIGGTNANNLTLSSSGCSGGTAVDTGLRVK